ncbi:hypothetical protein [Bacillus piscicola]|uniref:hypothetical protein n=1 Tax=Bacillus piscicola TaxID=1632684 RepID=UPI001F0977B0|nr:hypothetical protein [Bacillus piscicola]
MKTNKQQLKKHITTSEIKNVIDGWNGSYKMTKHNDQITSVTLILDYPCTNFRESQRLKKSIKSMYPHHIDMVLDTNRQITTAYLRITKDSLHDFLKNKNLIQEGHC